MLEGLRLALTLTAFVSDFSTARGDVRLDVLAGAAGGTEVLDGFATVAATTHEEGVLAGGGDGGKLVEGEAFTTNGFDALAGFAGEAEGTDAELAELGETDVIKDVTDNDGDGSLGLGGVLPDGLASHDDSKAGEGDGGAVATALEEALVDGCVEGGLGAGGQELVELQEELDVGIGRVGSCASEVLRLLDTVKINTHCWFCCFFGIFCF